STTTFTYTNATAGIAVSSVAGTSQASAASENGNTAIITTAAAHNLTVGQTVNIAGVTPAGYNGQFAVVSVPNTTTFTYTNAAAGLTPSTVSGTFQASGASETGNTAFIVTAAAHGLAVNQAVVI